MTIESKGHFDKIEINFQKRFIFDTIHKNIITEWI